MNSEIVTGTIKHFQEKPFGFYKYEQNIIEMAKAGSKDGNAFIHPGHIYKNWAREGFRSLEIIPGGL